jgi:predicted transcriptional regulator with HTH domain
MGDESKLVEDLTTKNVVIVVGYEHLLGHGASKFGLIDLLRKQKFNVTPLHVTKFGSSNEKGFPNEKEYYDKIREVQNFLIEFCRPAFDKSNISVKIHGLGSQYNGKYGIVHKLMENETNTFKVCMEEDKSTISVSKENLIFVQKIPFSCL